MRHSVCMARVVLLVLGGTSLITGGCSQDRAPSGQVLPTVPVAIKSPAQRSSIAPVQQPVSPSPTPSVGASVQPTVPESLSAKDQTLVANVGQDISQQDAIAKQDTGKTYLSNLLLSQQAEHLVRGRFTDDLKRLAPDFPTETEDYHLEVRQADAAQAVIVATAKQAGFSSYTGIVYAIAGKLPMVGICKTNVPSQTPPQTPKLLQAVVICPSGSSQVN